MTRRRTVTTLIAVVVASAPARADEALTGDKREIEGQIVRLFGIDAFEPGQTCLDARGEPWRCGAAAGAALAEVIQGHGVACTVVEERSPEEYVARCTVRDRIDIGRYMIMAGLALADPNAPDEYADAEAAARRARAGAWPAFSADRGTGASSRQSSISVPIATFCHRGAHGRRR